MIERSEQCLVQQLVAQPCVEALDEGILLWLAGRDIMPFNPCLLRPAQDRRPGEFGAIVRDAHSGSAASRNEGVKLAHDPQSGQRRVGHQRQAFPREVIDDRQDPEPSAIGECVRQEVQAPTLVGTLRQRHRRPCAQRTLAAATPAHLQPFLAVEPAELLVVHDYAFAREQDVQPSITEPPADGGELA